MTDQFICDESNQTFIFSLNLKKKYDMLDVKKNAICCGSFVGPVFGHDDLGFRKNMKEGFVSAKNTKCNFFTNKNLEIIEENGDKKYFKTKELEVYQLTF